MMNHFFDEQEDQSRIKAIIVEKYFKAWANVILAQRHVSRIAYIDLFAGPGRYKSGAISTPLLILTTAINDPILGPKLRKSLVTIFNDKDARNVNTLRTAIEKLPGIETLGFYPAFYNEEVGENFTQWFASQPMIPSFFFVDPWGYKGLSLRLVNAVLKDWGSDCVFFFNYNRISMGLNNDAVFEHMTALFGNERASILRQSLDKIGNPSERESQILENLVESLREMGGHFALPFRFRNERGTRTSHYLIFVSKSFRGYEIMKDIMATMSSSNEQGVASFEYSPATENQPYLFELNRPLDELAPLLLRTFAGQHLTLPQIYESLEQRRVTPFVEKHYRQALIQLMESGKISVTRPSGKALRKNTFPPDLIAQFPK
jgi:three-Cys-motif partner protein